MVVSVFLRDKLEGDTKENSDSHVLIADLRTEFPSVLNGQNRIFYSVQKDVIFLEIHDVLDKEEQEKILNALREKLRDRQFTESIDVSFHPKFVIEETKVGDGKRYGVVKKTIPLRQERLIPN